MSFLLPQFLWGLLALIPLMLVYLIKVHPVRKKTSAWFLWEGIFQERRAASLLQKLRDWLSLLLMVLAFIFLILALAQPVLRNHAAAERVVLIIDNSLSMNADGRMGEAQRAARGIIRSLPAGGRAAVFSLSGELLSSTGFTSSRRELMNGLDAIKASDTPFNSSALRHLTGSGDDAEQQRIMLFSDGCFRNAGELPEAIEFIQVGKPADNVGITAFDMRRIPGDDQPLGVFFRIYSSHTETVKTDAILTYGEEQNIRRVFALEVLPGLNEPQIISLPNGETGTWTLTLEIDDALDRDNTAFAVVPEIDPVRVAVRAPETHIFWELCVNAFGEGINGLEMTAEDPELELYRGAVSTNTADRLAVFAPVGSSVFWQNVSGEPFEAAVRVVLPSHPLIRYANLDGLVVYGVRDIRLPDQAVVLAETDEGVPLIYKTTQEGRTAYVLNFDPAQNYFFLNPLFPVLVWSVASELMELEQEPPASIRSGGSVKLPAGYSDGQVVLPDGEVLQYANGKFGPLDRFGFYTFEGEESPVTVACSCAPVDEINLDTSRVERPTFERAAGFPLSEWFIALALLLLATECALYHRRKVG